MASYYRGELGEVQVNESDVYKRRFPITVGTAETQTVTIRLPDGSSFAAASGATCAQIEGTQYQLEIPQALLDHRGIMYVKSAGNTDTQYGYIKIGYPGEGDASKRHRMNL